MPVISESIIFASTEPNFRRDRVKTLEELRNVKLKHYDVGHIVFCEEDGKHYKFWGENVEYDEKCGYFGSLCDVITDDEIDNILKELDVTPVGPLSDSDIYTESKLLQAMTLGGNYDLRSNLELSSVLSVLSQVKLNLNGFKLLGGLFTENNGIIEDGNTDSYVFWVKEGGDLTINGEGEIEAQNAEYSMAVWAQGGNVTINGGAYKNSGEEDTNLILATEGSVINITAGEFFAHPTSIEADEYSQIVISGGKFHNFDPTPFLAEGVEVTEIDGVYEVNNIPEKPTISNESELMDVVTNGGDVNLASNVNLSKASVVKSDAIIDLNGYSIQGGLFTESKGEMLDGNADSYAFWVKNGGKLTINGIGEVRSQQATYSMAVWAQGGEVIINGGSYYNEGECSDLIYASNGGKVYIYGGEFHASEKHPYEKMDSETVVYSALNVRDTDKSNSEIIVKGGKFYNFNPANASSECEGTNFVAEGYESVEVEPNVWEVRITPMHEFKEAIENGGEISLKENMELPLAAVVAAHTSIDLNNNNVTAGLFAEAGGSMNEGDTDSYAFWVKEGGELVIDGEGLVKTQPCKYSMAVWADGGNVTINGGTYENAGEGSDLIYASNGGNITINGGTFKPCETQSGVDGTKNTHSALNVKDKDYKSGASSIIVKGGKFYNFNPANNLSEGPNTNFVAEGYESVEVEPNVWEVRKV